MKKLTLYVAAAMLCAVRLGRRPWAAPPAAVSVTKLSHRTVISLDGTWQIAEGKMEPGPDELRPQRAGAGPGVAGHAGFRRAGARRSPIARAFRRRIPRRDAFWYRRTFTLDGPLPAVARLKVAKAMFGTRVFLNGTLLGDHVPSFTPGYFDARPALKTGSNEILIRVGADRDAVGRAYPDGFDFEKERYIPGIFDSVELILSGTPHFVTRAGCARHCRQDGPRAGRVAQRRRGGQGRRDVRRPRGEVRQGRRAVDQRAGRVWPRARRRRWTSASRWTDCRLWSPEDPFLYTLEADSGADTFRTRFGMREFKFDPATRPGDAQRQAVLPARQQHHALPLLRGQRVRKSALGREMGASAAPAREGHALELPALLHRLPAGGLVRHRRRDRHPHRRRVSDLVRRPGWSKWPKELKSENWPSNTREWMRERWNHPCVGDLGCEQRDGLGPDRRPPSGRCGRSIFPAGPGTTATRRRRKPGDMFESHPYHFQNAKFKLAEPGHRRSGSAGNATATTASTRSSSTNTAGCG